MWLRIALRDRRACEREQKISRTLVGKPRSLWGFGSPRWKDKETNCSRGLSDSWQKLHVGLMWNKIKCAIINLSLRSDSQIRPTLMQIGPSYTPIVVSSNNSDNHFNSLPCFMHNWPLMVPLDMISSLPILLHFEDSDWSVWFSCNKNYRWWWCLFLSMMGPRHELVLRATLWWIPPYAYIDMGFLAAAYHLIHAIAPTPRQSQ